MKKSFCVIISIMVLRSLLPAQTAERIEDLLDIWALSYGQAALFVLEAADVPDIYGSSVISGPDEAFRFAAEHAWLPNDASGEDTARLDGISLLLMKSFDVKGGLLYTLFRNSHYAYRELVYKDIIQGKSEPGMAVSGDLLLFLVNRLLSCKPGGLGQDYDIDKYIGMVVEEDQQELINKEIERRVQEKLAELEALTAEINTQLKAQAVEDASARVTDQGVTISLSNIQFMANSAELPEAEKGKLKEIARILQTISNHKVLVAGHTAEAGTLESQLRTSQDRAASVAAYLVFLGARRSDEIFAQGFGSERPIADNSTAQGMALNRRVEITILEDQ